MFLTIFNYFRQILVAFKYFVQSDVLYDHRKKPGTATRCKTKDSSCHRQSSVRVLSGIRAAQSSVFCVVFCRPLFIILSFFAWPLHCLPFFDIWLPITLLASTNFSYLLTYTRTTILSQLSNLFHCNIRCICKNILKITIIWYNEFLMVKD